MKPAAFLYAAVLALAGASALTIPQIASSETIGPMLGSRVATDVPLRTAAGKPTTLAAMSAGKPVMVVLFRSAAWCPYCQKQLKSLAPVAAAARAKGVRFVAVSYDKPDVLAAFAAKQAIPFPLLSDTGSKLIDALKLRDPQYARGSFAYGVPYPTILLLDARGQVKAKTVETDYKVRPSQADIIAMLDRA